MNPKTFLVIASFAIFLVVRGSLDDQEQFCRKNTEYNICRKVAFTYDFRCFRVIFDLYLPTLGRYFQMWLDLPTYPKI